MNDVNHGRTKKIVMEVLRMNSLFMGTTDAPLDLHISCVGNHQVYRDIYAHGWRFKTRRVKFGDHYSNQFHGRSWLHIPQKHFMAWYLRIDEINLSGLSVN